MFCDSRALKKVEGSSDSVELRYVLVQELVKSSVGRAAYLNSSLASSQNPQDIRLNKKILNYMSQFGQ